MFGECLANLGGHRQHLAWREALQRERSYTSGEQKSVSARYILVAAIINVTMAGSWNIYIAKDISINILDHS
jgi:hypothetical protein